jgi:chromosome segregation ATPase
MKKFIYVLLIPVLLLASGCNQRKAEIARLKAQNDSLRLVGTDKDSNIADFVTTFNEIESNLDSIKQLERVINKSAKAGEVKGSRKEQIKSDIQYIYDLLQKNRKLVADLTSKLSKTNKHNTELQKMIDNLNKSIEEKDAQIAQLTDGSSVPTTRKKKQPCLAGRRACHRESWRLWLLHGRRETPDRPEGG